MIELSPAELAPFLEACDMFREVYELPSASRYLKALLKARGWRLEAGETLAPPGWEEPAYVLLSGALTRAGQPSGDEAAAPVHVQRVFHEWTSLADGLDAPDVVAAEPSVVLEAPADLLQLLLSGTPSRFKVEYYAPLVCRSPVLAGISAEALDAAIRQSSFHAHNTREDLVTEGEFGTSVYFILAGRAAVLLPEGAPRILEAGDFFGEVAYVSRQRRTATVRSSGPVLVMECRPHAVAKLIKASRPFKEAMDERYRAYGTFAVLSGMELFAGLDVAEFRELCHQGSLETFFQYEPVFFKGDPADALYVILNGTVTLTDEREGGTSPAGWLHAGDLVGEMALFPQLSGSPNRGLTVTALQRVTAVRFSRDEVGNLVERYPAVGARILGIIERRRAGGGLTAIRNKRPLEWVLDTQFLAGNHVLAVDLDNCIRCNNCVTACQSVHLDGQNRFFWSGMREEAAALPRVSFSTSCQHCEVPLCLEACPQNCIERSPETGAVYIDYNLCTRCGVCADPAQGCPYGSIQKVSNAEVDPEASLPLLTRMLRRFSRQPAPRYGPERQANHYPVKCDLCADLPFQACVEHCPTGAVFRVSGQTEFARLLQPGGTPESGPSRAPRTVYLSAGFTAPSPTGRFSPLVVQASESGPGIPVTVREPENGRRVIDLNLFLLAPDAVEVQGGREKAPLRRLTLGEEAVEGAKFPVKCALPGPQELVLCVYQGGLYLGRAPVQAEFVAAAPKAVPAAPKAAPKETE